LLSGVPLAGNFGDDTIYSMGFSGPYEAGLQDQWRLVRLIPLEGMGQILSQAIKVSVR
jgi:hypothetical protein